MLPRSANVALGVTSLLCLILALKTSSDPLPAALGDGWIESALLRLPTGNSVLFGLSVGFLVSMVFFLLVVVYPQRRKANRVRRNFLEQYRWFKEDTISIFLAACESCDSGDLRERLCSLAEFRRFFQEKADEERDRWSLVLNGLSDELLLELRV